MTNRMAAFYPSRKLARRAVHYRTVSDTMLAVNVAALHKAGFFATR